MKYKVLVVDDEESIRQSLKDILEDEDYKVYLAKNRSECVELIKNFYFPVILLDLWLPDSDNLNLLEDIMSISPNSKVIVITGHANIELAINSIKKGAFDFLEKPLSLDKTLLSVKKALEENINERLKMISSDYLFIGSSPKISSLKETAAKIAKTDIPIVIYGESGTGKELLARMIHSLSDRKDKSFVDINCAAIPDELIESELFGYEKGAFTGAFSRKLGKLEIANSGTLFLDEIGDLSLKAQAKLLRALETKSFTRLGGTQNIEVDIRVICASNKNLKEEISKGNFREDLFYRLSVFSFVQKRKFLSKSFPQTLKIYS